MPELKSKKVCDEPAIYQIPVPNPRPGSNPTNAYLVADSGESLLVDTGVDSDAGLSYLRAALAELDVDLSRLSVLLTHFHQDHSGLVGRLGFGGRLLIGKTEYAAWSGQNRLSYIERVGEYVTLMGEPAEVSERAVNMVSLSTRPPEAERFETVFLQDGDTVRVGSTAFRVLELPGHSIASIALYQPEEHVLLSGDVIIFEVTPALALPDADHNYLRLYLESVGRLLELPIELILPGHGSPQGDPSERIEWLIAHHGKRLGRAREIVLASPGGIKAGDLARQLHWNAPTKGRSQFIISAHVLVVLASVSYLDALAREDGIERTVEDGVWRFSPAPAPAS